MILKTISVMTRQPNPDFDYGIASLRSAIRRGDWVIALFDRVLRSYLPDANALISTVDAERVVQLSDGVVLASRVTAHCMRKQGNTTLSDS
jgi:hypothetical protein